MAVTAGGQQQQQQQQPPPALVVKKEPPANSSLGLLGNRWQQMMIAWWRDGSTLPLPLKWLLSPAFLVCICRPQRNCRFPSPFWSLFPPHGGNITPAAEASSRKKTPSSLSPHNGNSGLISRCAALLHPAARLWLSVAGSGTAASSRGPVLVHKYLSTGMIRIKIPMNVRDGARTHTRKKCDLMNTSNLRRVILKPLPFPPET